MSVHFDGNEWAWLKPILKELVVLRRYIDQYEVLEDLVIWGEDEGPEKEEEL